MKAHYRLKALTSLLVPLAILISIAGCASGRSAYKRGSKAEAKGDYDAAFTEYKLALDKDPSSIDNRLKYQQSRFEAAFMHFQNGRHAFDKGDLETAKKEFERTLELDPTNDFAAQELQKVNQAEQNRERKQPEAERKYEDLRDANRTDPRPQSQMQPKITEPITFRMTQDSRVAFETLADLAGFNVIFDRDFRGTRIPIELNNVDIYQALDILALQTGSFWEPLNKNTILISPDNQTKRREYEQHVLKTVYLSNSVTSTEITEAITAIRTILSMRYIAQSTAMNAIILRDTPDKIAIAERILEDIDKSKPEVVVEALILEVDRNTLFNLGITPPSSTTATFGNPATTTATSSGNVVSFNNLSKVFNSSNWSLTIPPITAQALASNSNAKLLQNPEVRATDGKLASIRIGEKVPVPSGSFQPAFVGATGTPVVQYVYQDIGVNLDITPRVLLNREVSLTVLVQVSALAGDRDAGGLKLPVFTNRSIQHEIRLVEGETNILGGIITTIESTSMSGLPFLKDLPILKYLFGNESRMRDNTEIIVMLTPHIVRMPNLNADNLQGIYIGTEANTRLRIPTVPPSPPPLPSAQQPAAPATTPSRPPARPLPPGVSIGTPSPAPAPPPAQPRTTNTAISFDPDPIAVAAGTPTPVNIQINGSDIYAADLTLSFDPASVKIQEIRDGGFLSRDGQIIALVQKIESDTGTARIALERPPGATPLSGSGTLVTLMLQPGAQKGESALRVIDFRLRDAQQNVSVGRAAETRVTVP